MAERYDALKVEADMQAFWDEEKTYEKIKNNLSGKKPFYFLDGPPYTSGKVHLGTAWNKSLKDMILRYKRMKGFEVWDRAGYDMHGLPTEHATEKKLGLNGKEGIIEFGVDKFVQECKQLCIDNMNVMNDDFKRLGVWMDFENAYQSVTNDFIDGEWWLLKTAHEKERLYRGFRTMTWCKNCATALAKHELEYEEVKDTSIFVKFKVKGKENEYLIIWTTTPWTIPLNLAVMVNPELDYVKAKVDGEVWILSKALGPMVVQSVANKTYEQLEEFKGIKLKGLQYEHFFADDMKYNEIEAKSPENMHTVIMSSEFVDTTAGTGLVHCAPGCGPEDYEVGHKHGLPAFNVVDEKGVFHTGRFDGLVAKDDDKKMIELIDQAGHLIATSEVEHDYAHCWRCKTGVIFRTTKQWFFKVEDIKEKMIKENNDIKWVPHTAYNAFNSWLENLRDNSISKQRFWGTPIPVWVNTEDEDDYFVVGSIKELEELSGEKVEDPHIPKIDHITIEKDGKTYKRVPDILDVWVDAGSASWNCLYYPHKTDLMDKLFPAEFILEGKDQIRGWFNLLHVASMISMDRPSFKNVYMHGFIQDSKGRKMSKSLGNYILPSEVIEKYGADTFRYYIIGGANPGMDLNYNPEDVELKHKNLNVLWNLTNFVADFFSTNDISEVEDFGLEEQYMLSYLHSKIKEVTESFEGYRLNEIPLLVEQLFLELSRGYIQLIRDKAQGSTEEKNQVGTVLKQSMLAIVDMFSTVAPFISDKLYQTLRPVLGTSELSVHERSWPEYNATLINEDIIKQMNLANSIMQGILFAREKAQLGVRWPVKEILVQSKKKEVADAVSVLGDIIKQQTNIKSLQVVEKVEGVTASFKPDMGKLGRAHGEKTGIVAEGLKSANVTEVLQAIEEKNKYVLNGEFDILSDQIIVERETPEHLREAPFKDGFVYLDSTRTPELEAEGFSRELIRRIQALRKNEGMVRADSIELFIQAPADLVEGLSNHVDSIKTITGSVGLMIDSNTSDKEYPVSSTEKIKGKEFGLFFERK